MNILYDIWLITNNEILSLLYLDENHLIIVYALLLSFIIKDFRLIIQ